MFAGKKSAQIREILISESAWEEMTCLFAPSLTIIIISPVIYFSWDAVKGTSGSDYVESVVFILMAGFAMSVCYLFFSALEKVINARKSKDESIYHD